MTFRHLSTLLVALLCTVASAAERPNILFILIDDMGWMDIACQGNEHVHTPDINRLASEGIRFTDAYAAARNARREQPTAHTGGPRGRSAANPRAHVPNGGAPAAGE